MTERALDGIRILDFTRVFAGPFTTQLLGDLGAEVIKIEPPEGDEVRTYMVRDPGDTSAAFLAFNRNKRSVSLDIKTAHGREAIRRLVLESDVLVENFRPGVMERLGIGPDDVLPENPALIYCRISGFGRGGRFAGKAANDIVVQAFSGLMSVLGHEGDDPVRSPAAVADLSAGLYATVGILAALNQRHTTGRGQVIETTLHGSLVAMMSHVFAEYWETGVEPRKIGSRVYYGSPNQAFPTSDGFVVIAAISDRNWARCCEALGAAQLARDPRFVSQELRDRNREALVDEVSRLTSALTSSDCIDSLESFGVSCAPVRGVAEVASDGLLEDLDCVMQIDVGGRTSSVIGSPVRLAESPTPASGTLPGIGDHTAEVLRSVGFEPAEVDSVLTHNREVLAESIEKRSP